MRALAVLTAMALGGCSALYNGHDLHGTGGGGSGGGSGGAGGGGGGGAGGGGGGGGGGAGGGGGGGGTSGCTPRATIKFTQTTPSAAAMGPYFIALSDINKDGKLDIVTANYSANSFSVLLGDGAGGFTLAASTPVSTCNTPQIVLTRDISNDGLDDVIIACYTNSGPAAGVDVFVNQSTTTMVKFAARKQVTLASMNGLPYTVTGKFVGDANVDLAIVDPNGNTVRLYAGDGAGNFTLSATTYPTGMGGSWMTVGDLNGDSADDIVVYNETDDDMTRLQHAGAARLRHDGDGHALFRHRPDVALRHQPRRAPRHHRHRGRAAAGQRRAVHQHRHHHCAGIPGDAHQHSHRRSPRRAGFCRLQL
jgi:hypothetical protein